MKHWTMLMLVSLCLVDALTAQRRGDAEAARQGPWPIKTREHVDLWLHGFALITSDTSSIPLFRRGYRDSLVVLRNQSQLVTRLDSFSRSLQRGMSSPQRLLNAQFYALHFSAYAPLRASIALMTAVNGESRAAPDKERAQLVALASNYFAFPAEREWAERFTTGLDDESARFHHTNWLQTQRERSPALAKADSLWRTEWFPKLSPFLRGMQLRTGEIIASVVVEGEGRTVTVDASVGTSTVVTLPATPEQASELLYGIVHEVVGGFAEAAVTENITPRQKAAGLGDRLQTAAALHAGLLLLAETIPAEVEGYAAFYLRVLGKPAALRISAGKALHDALPLNSDILETMKSRLELLLRGL